MARFALFSLLVSACTFNGAVKAIGASGDIAPGDEPDASGPTTDADPLQPDAGPIDANVPAIDASPDAGAGIVVFRDGLEGYTGTVDTFINSMMGDTSFGDVTSIKWENDSIEHGLLRFDNIFGTGANRVPLGAPIVSATLSITIFDSTNSPSSLVEAKVDWNESVTSNTFGPAAGVQADDMEVETIAVVPTPVGTHALDVTESLRRWSDQTRVNRGWVIVSGDINDCQCYSSEYTTTPTERPMLEVEYMWP